MLRRRRAVVVDKKLRDGEGEYAELTRWFGAEPFRFDPDDPGTSTCMNVLDPVILAGGGPAAAAGSCCPRSPSSPATAPWTSGTTPPSARRTGPPCAEFEDARRVPVIPDLLDQHPRRGERPGVRRAAAGDAGPDRAGRLVAAVPARTAAGRRPGRHVRPGNLATCGAAPEADHVRRVRAAGGRARHRDGDGRRERLADGHAHPRPRVAHQLHRRRRLAPARRAGRQGHPVQVETVPRPRAWPSCRRSTTSPTSRRAPTPSR